MSHTNGKAPSSVNLSFSTLQVTFILSRFPSLYGYLYEQLNASKDEFSVYPTLIFLTHLFPSSAGIAVVVDGNESCKATRNFPLAPFILALLRVLLWCRAEKLRRLTVAALVAIATPKVRYERYCPRILPGRVQGRTSGRQ